MRARVDTGYSAVAAETARSEERHIARPIDYTVRPVDHNRLRPIARSRRAGPSVHFVAHRAAIPIARLVERLCWVLRCRAAA